MTNKQINNWLPTTLKDPQAPHKSEGLQIVILPIELAESRDGVSATKITKATSSLRTQCDF